MDYLPLFHNIAGRKCLLVGSGQAALAKARLLLRANADIHLVSNADISEEFELLLKENNSTCYKQYNKELLDNCALVIAACDETELEQTISRDAHSKNIPVNIVDKPDLSTVITPAIIDRSPMLFAISSSGKSPVLSRQYKAMLDSTIPPRLGDLALIAEEYRQKITDLIPDFQLRRRFWEEVLSGPTASHSLNGKPELARDSLEQQLNQFLSDNKERQGEVYLVGAGPGDPDLLTFRALRLMQQAEIVLYDRLVSQPILDMCRKDAEYIYVGKARSKHTMPQGGINELLAQYARKGYRVLRLKGGDPFIFGRGGEEISSLAEKGIPFQVVPGITAATGCASYAGIPLTHRDYAQSVRFITGHLKDNSIDLPWSQLNVKNQTLVFYMALTGLNEICRQLIANGNPASTPAALIERGTTKHQQVIVSNLEGLPQLVANKTIHPPTLLIIGEVVKLHEKLNWYGK